MVLLLPQLTHCLQREKKQQEAYGIQGSKCVGACWEAQTSSMVPGRPQFQSCNMKIMMAPTCQGCCEITSGKYYAQDQACDKSWSQEFAHLWGIQVQSLRSLAMKGWVETPPTGSVHSFIAQLAVQ